MTLASDSLTLDVKLFCEVGSCVGPCTGYDSCSNCPPLIVLAVFADYATTVPVVYDLSGEPQ